MDHFPRFQSFHTDSTASGSLPEPSLDRKSTRLNSSHGYISYAVFCLKKNTLIFFFFFNDTATTEIYTLSLHDALPIWPCQNSDEKLSEKILGHIRPVRGFSIAANDFSWTIFRDFRVFTRTLPRAVLYRNPP